MKLSWRLRQAWFGFTGRSYREWLYLRRSLDKAECLAAEADQLKRDLELAKAAITELKTSRPYDALDRRKESDRLAEAAIAKMNAEAKYYKSLEIKGNIAGPLDISEKAYEADKTIKIVSDAPIKYDPAEVVNQLRKRTIISYGGTYPFRKEDELERLAKVDKTIKEDGGDAN